jgi:hypothetical protein
MKQTSTRTTQVVLPICVGALGIILTYGSFVSRADTNGPVVGFQRLEIGAGPQWVSPSVQPFAPQTIEGETTGQVLVAYLGEDFLTGTNANDADWVGCNDTQNGSGEVMMTWCDRRSQWHDLTGNSVDPTCTNAIGFWFDLTFYGVSPTNQSGRELVLSGQTVW